MSHFENFNLFAKRAFVGCDCSADSMGEIWSAVATKCARNLR